MRRHALAALLPLAAGCVEHGTEAANRAPILEAPIPRTVDEGELLQLTLLAKDPDGDTLTYGSSGLPEGATLDPVGGELVWTPSFEQAGDHAIPLHVTDDGSPPASARVRLIVSVADVNRPPTFDGPGPISGWTGSRITVRLKAEDPDGDAVSVRCANAPDGMRIDEDTGRIDWVPACDQAGRFAL